MTSVVFVVTVVVVAADDDTHFILCPEKRSQVSPEIDRKIIAGIFFVGIRPNPMHESPCPELRCPSIFQGEIAQSSPSDSSSRGGERGTGYVAPSLYSKIDGDDGGSPDGEEDGGSVDVQDMDMRSRLRNGPEDPSMP